VKFIQSQELSTDQGSLSGNPYVTLGFPCSKNKKNNRPKRQVRPSIWSYGATALQDLALAKKLKVSGDDHIFLGFDPDKSKEVTGAIVNSLEPVGMSGGALVNLGCIAHPDNLAKEKQSPGRFAGVLIEVRRREKRIVAVKVDLLLRGLFG
jgi:hypothetical protein